MLICVVSMLLLYQTYMLVLHRMYMEQWELTGEKRNDDTNVAGRDVPKILLHYDIKCKSTHCE